MRALNPNVTLRVYCTPDFHQLVQLLRLPWLEDHSKTGKGDDSLLRALAPQR